MQKFLATLIATIIFFQAVLFGSGLYGVMLENDARFCSCNHASAKEIHQNEEDRIFKTKRIVADAGSENESLKPNCHNNNAGESHLCICKKAKKKSAFLQTFVINTSIIVIKQRIYPQLSLLFTVGPEEQKVFSGISFSRYKPPKV